MAKRIKLIYTCNHPGIKLPPVEVKDWDTTLPPGRVCWCCNDPEKHLPMPTPMSWTVSIENNKPE
jgi:hypothetical protein